MGRPTFSPRGKHTFLVHEFHPCLVKFILDSRERAPLLKKHAAETKLLRYGNGVESYDIHLVADDDTETRWERKTARDYINSFDKIPRQVANVDGLILEGWKGPTAHKKECPPQVAGKDWARLVHRAHRRLQHLTLMVPVVHTSGEKDTLSFLEYLGERGSDLGFRENKVKSRNVKQAMLSALPGINPDKKIGKRRFGNILEKEAVDWELILEGLSPEEWQGRGWGVGKITVARIEEEMS